MHLLLAAKLAWANTTISWQRLMVRCSGIMFAVVLMFMQNGFRNALFDSNVRIVEEKIKADIVFYTKSRFMLSAGQPMPARFIEQARNCEGVQSVEPLYIENMSSELRPRGRFSRRVRVISFDVRHPAFADFGLEPLAEKLEMPETGAADSRSKPMFQFPPEIQDDQDQIFGELAGKQIRLVGTFELGMDFSNDGNLVVSPRNFGSYFPMRGGGQPLSAVDYGILRCQPGSDVRQVADNLAAVLGDTVTVKTKSEFLQSERKFWGSRTPIGLIFLVGTLIGFLVGLIICYQVLATDIANHMGEFATINAMGYPASFFAAVVVVQALLIAVVSFVPGTIIAAVSFQFLNSIARLGMYLDAYRILSVFLLTVLMCVISGLIALRKLIANDPASLF
jgi:putative ABC transport system permease protein